MTEANGTNSTPGDRGDASSENGSGRPTRARRLRRALAWLVLLPWLATFAAWVLGRAVGDRFLPTQYLEWVPTAAVALSGLVVFLLARLVAGRRWRGGRLPGLLVAGVMLWLALAEWTLWRAVLPRDKRPADVRVVFMNISPGEETADLSPIFEQDAGIVVLSNVHPNRVSFRRIYGVEKASLLERTVGVVPGGTPADEVHAVLQASFMVFSKWPVRRYTSAAVGVQETFLKNDTQGGGQVLMLEIDAPGGPLVVWGVDMPSTLGASRRALFEEASRKVREWRRVTVFDEIGRRTVVDREPGDPLLTPDIVVGDFNTPAHAWSVARFARGLRPVRADTGWGPRGTWPIDVPLWEIDLAKLGPAVSALRAGRVRVDGCRHFGLWMDLRRAGRAD